MPDHEITTRIEAIQKFDRARRAAESWSHPNLSAQGNAEKRAEKIAQAEAELRQHFESTELANARAQGAKDSAKRSLVTFDHGKLIARKMAWERVSMLLAAGRELKRIIASTDDPETLAAIVEWGPTWVQAQSQVPPMSEGGHPATHQEPETTWIGDAVVERLAEVGHSEAKRAMAVASEATAAGMWSGVVDSVLQRHADPVALSALSRTDPVAYDAIRDTVFGRAAAPAQ